MRISTPSPARPLALTALAGAGMLALCVPSASAATPTHFVYGGSVYGSTASVGSTIHSGQTAKAPLCSTKPSSSSNKTAAVSLGKVGSVGAVTTKVAGKADGSMQTSTSMSQTAKTSLATVVSFSAMTTTAQAGHSSSGFTASGHTTFVGLKLAGKSVSDKPGEDQTYHLAGLGTLVLNHVSKTGTALRQSSIVTGLRLTIDVKNTRGLAAGTVVIGHAAASLHLPVHHLAYGTAYATSVALGSTVTSGDTAAAYLDCGGTDGVTHTNDIAGVSVPSVLKVGAAKSYTDSTDSSSATRVTTKSHIADVDLLGGVVKASAITAEATATRTSSGLTTSAAGTATAGLVVNGRSLGSRFAANTTIKIKGVGTLVVNQVYHTADHTGLQVHALALTLSRAYGSAKAGSVVIIGSARAGVDD